MNKDIIYRHAAIDAINHICPVDTEYDCTLLDRVDVRYVLSDLPSVQPEHTETHESRREWYMKGYRDAQAVSCTDLCVDCPLFDHEKHECPRFNRVIPRAIEEAKPMWIPCEDCEKRCEKWENSKT